MAENQIELHIPYFAKGEVVSGFGRGSKELGIPTANFPESVIRELPSSFECGVYYGWAKLSSCPEVFKMTMCVGWNPYYHNTVKTMETHIIHKFDSDFYGDIMKIIVLGFIRPMCNFPSLDALIKAIHNDIEVSSNHLNSEESLKYKDDPFFRSEGTEVETSAHQRSQESAINTESNNLDSKAPHHNANKETYVTTDSNGVYDRSNRSTPSLSKEDFSKTTSLISDNCKHTI